MIASGNYDSEGGGGEQLFANPSGSNTQSDLAPFNEEMRFRATPDYDYYASVGFEMMRLQQRQQMLAQQTSMQLEPMQLQGFQAKGFDQNWLSERLAAGSANGAKI